MGKIKRLTSLYEALATMRRENLQTSFDLVELIHKINDDMHIENPETYINVPDLETLKNDDIPNGVRLKWALIALGRAEREIKSLEAFKQKNIKLNSKLENSKKSYEKLVGKYREMKQAKKIESPKSKKLNRLIQKNNELNLLLAKQQVRIKYLERLLANSNNDNYLNGGQTIMNVSNI